MQPGETLDVYESAQLWRQIRQGCWDCMQLVKTAIENTENAVQIGVLRHLSMLI